MFEPTTPHPQLFLPTHGGPTAFPPKSRLRCFHHQHWRRADFGKQQVDWAYLRGLADLPPCFGAMEGVFRQGLDVLFKSMFWLDNFKNPS